MSIAIKVENLSKKYIIGHQKQQRYTALRDVLANGAKRMAGKLLHPFAKESDDPAHEEFWALKDISFDIQQGDRVGIIGRNGAGKSTLLKVLSRITEPTSGKIRINGRVASLLEVGTGFHPELTGRENIYLNGAILGMSRAEIRRKFDEIVAFAEVEKFLDTPVKHYSSGMYVRLAFAVAAHLEPEILIVDEVLAVGDAQFQEKCMGRMETIGKEGRTVLFVSHSMGMVAELCNSAILLGKGNILTSGPTRDVIDHYLCQSAGSDGYTAAHTGSQEIYVEKVRTLNPAGISTSSFPHDEPIQIAISCMIRRWDKGSVLGFYVMDQRGRKVFTSNCTAWGNSGKDDSRIELTAAIPASFLVPGRYSLSFTISIPHIRIIDNHPDAIGFDIIDSGTEFAAFEGYDYGCVFAQCEWAVVSIAPESRLQ